MKEDKHLSLFGIGPFYVGLIFIITLVSILLNNKGLIPSYSIEKLEIIIKVFSVFLFILGAVLWVNAVFIVNIDKNIKKNELVTSGSYAYVRNPIYSAITFFMYSFLLWSNNLFLIILFPIYHVILFIMLKYTEEKWLYQKYGKKYLVYCDNVNRFIPWFPKKNLK